ncbi:MAG: hydrogenase maturation nickel metallochaperone HypA [Thermofilum sp.]|nr:hydrogenase maturation nickel metallochaperone HypA [Thermofilum sp.]
MQRVELRVKPFKLRCKSCGAESAVEASRPGHAVFVCSACGAAHLMLLDHDLNLRALEPVEVVEGLPAGYHSIDVDGADAPATLREVLAKAAAGSAPPEEVRLAFRALKRLNLLG